MSTRTGALQCAFAMTILGASVPVSRLVLGFPDLTGVPYSGCPRPTAVG